MLLLLLRLLTAPATLFPAAATVETVARPQPTQANPASLSDARAYQADVDAGPAKIRALMRVANDTQYRASCVAQRLAEAQVHVALARDEMHRLARRERPARRRPRARAQAPRAAGGAHARGRAGRPALRRR